MNECTSAVIGALIFLGVVWVFYRKRKNGVWPWE